MLCGIFAWFLWYVIAVEYVRLAHALNYLVHSTCSHDPLGSDSILIQCAIPS